VGGDKPVAVVYSSSVCRFFSPAFALIAGSLGIISIESFIESEVPWYLVFLIGPSLFGTIGRFSPLGEQALPSTAAK